MDPKIILSPCGRCIAFEIESGSVYNPLMINICFLTEYCPWGKTEIFEEKDRGFLKLICVSLSVYLFSFLSMRCFHHLGGAKMMLREVRNWMKPGDFVYKTDIYSYYASINHEILVRQLEKANVPEAQLTVIKSYCKRIILSIGRSLFCEIGIPKGGALSPILGALYLTPLDRAMERWMARGDCFYARFQDDIILISRKRHVLRRMRKEMFQILDTQKLIIRPEKTQVGRCEKGFDLLGYHVTLKGLFPSIEAQKKAFETAKRRYAQGGEKSLQLYLKRWRTWAHAGLNDQVLDVNGILNQIVYHINNDVTRPHTKRSRTIWMKTRVNSKGKQSWIKKFSGHW